MRAEPRQWTRREFHDEANKSMVSFRQKRISEPTTVWRQMYLERRSKVRRVFALLGLRIPRRPPSRLISKLYSLGLGDVLRYMAAPPVSEDDLKVVADVRLSRRALGEPSKARSLLRVLLISLDPVRFPWIGAGTRPGPGEWRVAIESTAALMTSQAVATRRRNTGKREQESAVRDYLRDLGMTEVHARDIRTLRDAPRAGEFCGESAVMGEKADIVVCLFDNRLLLIECKVSNSALNSYKRVVHEAAGKATHWLSQLGRGQVVAAAVLSGVFSANNLMQAQEKNLSVFWAHRLDDLGSFIASTR